MNTLRHYVSRMLIRLACLIDNHWPDGDGKCRNCGKRCW